MQALSVWILDDDPVVGLLIDTVAQGVGASTRRWHEPLAFLQQSLEPPPTYIVLDMRMPQMHGSAVLGELARRQCPSRIILTSGNPLEADQARQRWQTELDIAGVLAKPFRAAQLRALLS